VVISSPKSVMSMPKTAIPDGFASTNGSISITVVSRATVWRQGCGVWSSVSEKESNINVNKCLHTCSTCLSYSDKQIRYDKTPDRLHFWICFPAATCCYELTGQRRENGECHADCNVASKETEFADCFVFVPDGSREFAVAHRVDDDANEEDQRAKSCAVHGRRWWWWWVK
jgi:hypothetical protein